MQNISAPVGVHDDALGGVLGLVVLSPLIALLYGIFNWPWVAGCCLGFVVAVGVLHGLAAAHLEDEAVGFVSVANLFQALAVVSALVGQWLVAGFHSCEFASAVAPAVGFSILAFLMLFLAQIQAGKANPWPLVALLAGGAAGYCGWCLPAPPGGSIDDTRTTSITINTIFTPGTAPKGPYYDDTYGHYHTTVHWRPGTPAFTRDSDAYAGGGIYFWSGRPPGSDAHVAVTFRPQSRPESHGGARFYAGSATVEQVSVGASRVVTVELSPSDERP
jgi:hypothetical protein